MNTRKFTRISPLRHAVSVLIGLRRDAAWLQSQLIVYTANNIRSRHKRFLLLLDRGQPGAKMIYERMQLRMRGRLATYDGDGWPYSLNSLECYLDGALFNETYIASGTGGVSAPARLGRVTRLLKRAREMTLGSDRVDWFFEGVGSELSRFMGDGFEVKLSRVLSRVDDNAEPQETIAFAVVFKEPPANEEE